jgi:hypothetical protein
VLTTLVDGVEIAGDRDGGSADGSRSRDTGVFGFDGCAGLGGWVQTIEVDLDDGVFGGRFDGCGAEERSLRFGWSGRSFDGFHSEQVGIRGQDDGGDASIFGGEKWPLRKGLAAGEVGEGSEGSEGIADAQEEVTVTEAPQILAVVVRAPGGAGEGVAGGELDQDGVDGAVHIVLWLVGQPGEEVAGAEGEQKMLVVDVVDGQHGAACEEELLGQGLESELVQGEAKRRLGAAGGEEGWSEEKKKSAHEREAVAKRRNERSRKLHGNRHGSGRVSLLTESARVMVSQTRERCQCMQAMLRK